MIAKGTDILNFIPQRPPVVMIDALIECSERETVSSFTIPEDNLFCENGVFVEAGLLENIAQTAAAKVGYECSILKKEVPPGFIAAIKNFEVTNFPKAGDTLLTRVVIEQEVLGITLITGTVSLGNDIIAKAEMKILLNATSHL